MKYHTHSRYVLFFALYRPHSGTVDQFLRALEGILDHEISQRSEINGVCGDNILNQSIQCVNDSLSSMQVWFFFPVRTWIWTWSSPPVQIRLARRRDDAWRGRLWSGHHPWDDRGKRDCLLHHWPGRPPEWKPPQVKGVALLDKGYQVSKRWYLPLFTRPHLC